MKATVTATFTGYIVRVTDARGKDVTWYRRQSDTSYGIELWGEAVREAASRSVSSITWQGWPDLDQAIRDYVAAGGKL